VYQVERGVAALDRVASRVEDDNLRTFRGEAQRDRAADSG